MTDKQVTPPHHMIYHHNQNSSQTPSDYSFQALHIGIFYQQKSPNLNTANLSSIIVKAIFSQNNTSKCLRKRTPKRHNAPPGVKLYLSPAPSVSRQSTSPSSSSLAFFSAPSDKALSFQHFTWLDPEPSSSKCLSWSYAHFTGLGGSFINTKYPR